MINVFWSGRIANRDKIIQTCEQYLYDNCPNVEHNVDVVVDIVTEIDDQLAGYCVGDHEYIEIKLARRSENQYYTREELLITLTHELVHAKQFIQGQIPNKIKHIPYKNQIWESEAYSLEKPIYQKYFKQFS